MIKVGFVGSGFAARFQYHALERVYGLPVEIGEVLVKHLGISLAVEGTTTVGPFLYYANRANNDYNSTIAGCNTL